MFILDYLFSTNPWKDSLTFKGGTSLSKGFHLIERFSEDIDLILDWRVIGYRKTEPWEQRSNTKQEKFNKESNRRVGEFLKNEFLPQMKSDLQNIIQNKSHMYIDDTDPQTILFEYPNSFSSSYVVEKIRLEIGALAAWTPASDVAIIPYIEEFYPNAFKEKETILRTVSPIRTFWEKATILHHEANRPETLSMPKRYSRHYYDLYCIANSHCKEAAIGNTELLEEVVLFKKKFYPRKWAKYEEATIETIRLLPNEYRFEEIRKDYKDMREMFFGEYPTFETLMEEIKRIEDKIHKSKY